MYCPKCGTKNDDNAYKCVQCGDILQGAPQTQFVVTDDATLGGLIPYKNVKAMVAYYLGMFAILPGIGIPMGIAALILGVQGLKFAGLHPEARGKVHAWIGIILGGFWAVGYTILIAVLVIIGLRK
jgi:hypothetical protein